MVVKTIKEGVVQLFLNDELQLEQAGIDTRQELEQNAAFGGVNIGTYHDYETWSEHLDYSVAYVGKGASLTGYSDPEAVYDSRTLVNVYVDGSIVADEEARISGINITGGTYSGSALCENAIGSTGAGICLSASDANGDWLYFYAGAEITGEIRGAVYLTGATFSKCSVYYPGSHGLGGAVETYGGTLSVQNGLFSENSAGGDGSAGGAMALMYSSNTITGSTFSGNSAYFGGAVQQQNGTLEVSSSLFQGNRTTGDVTDTYTTGNGGGAIELHEGATAAISGCTFTENASRSGGAIFNDTFNGSACTVDIAGSTFSGNAAELQGGAIYNYAVLTVTDSIFVGNKIVETETNGEASFGGAISNTQGGAMTVTDCTFSGNTAGQGGAVWNDGSMKLNGIVLSTASDTIYNGGSLTFAGVNTLGAEVVNNGSITFGVIAGTDALISDLGMFSGTGSYLLTLATDAVSAGALFAASAGKFTGSLSVKLDDTVLSDAFTLTGGVIGNDLAMLTGDKALRLFAADGALTFKLETLEKLVPTVSNDGSVLAWTDDEHVGGYWVEIAAGDSFGTAIRIATDGTAFDVVSRAGAYSCRTAEKDGEFTTDASSWSSGETGPRQIVSNANGRADIFFASIEAGDVWSSVYQAKNTVTGETHAIAGKNRIRDTFTGSESDANILYLSDTANGDALFMDDVYSEFGGAARLSLIREVRAGAGDDVVDMTSNRYSAELAGMTVRGGSGTDVIWGAAGGNKLFGDEGNDLISGGAGDDLIAGGAGDDVLAGGGGHDIFTFGENWGNDVVSQVEGGAVTLWFASGDESKWDASTMTYTDGDNSVTVSGVESVTLQFGSEKNPDRFAELDAVGAFLGSTAESVFETESARTQGILASL